MSHATGLLCMLLNAAVSIAHHASAVAVGLFFVFILTFLVVADCSAVQLFLFMLLALLCLKRGSCRSVYHCVLSAKNRERAGNLRLLSA